MGTWIAHLRIAENLLTEIPGLDEAAFTCGSLAPDSGLPNEDWTAFDPPKEVTHFLDRGQDEGKIRDLEFYRNYLAGLRPADENYSFSLAYFFHLICDNLWSTRIGRPSREIYWPRFASQAEAIQNIKGDWYGLDLKYVRDNPDHLFWRVFMNAANPPAPLPFLNEKALHHQLDHIRQFYSRSHEDLVLDREYPFLNAQTMDKIVVETTRLILRIHVYLEGGAAIPDENRTALSLLPDFEFSGYSMPLGDMGE